jgi:hypothetical protein
LKENIFLNRVNDIVDLGGLVFQPFSDRHGNERLVTGNVGFGFLAFRLLEEINKSLPIVIAYNININIM